MQTMTTPETKQAPPRTAYTVMRRLAGSFFVWLLIVLVVIDVALVTVKPLRFVRAGGLMFADCDPLTDKVHALGAPTTKYNTLVLGSSLAVSATSLPDFVRSGQKDIATEELKRYTGAKALDQSLSEALGVSLKSFNAALYGCMICEDVALYNTAMKSNSPPKLVILLAAPRDFIDNTILPEKTSHVISYLKDEELGLFGGARTFSENFDSFCGHVWRFYQVRSDYSRLAQLLTCGLLDRSPDLFTATHNGGFANKQALDVGFIGGKAGHIMHDRRVTPAEITKDQEGYRARYLPVDMARYKAEMANVQKFLVSARQNGVVPLVVNMPLELDNRVILPAGFLQQYRSDLSKLCSANGTAYEDFVDSPEFVGDQYFLDNEHLSSRGADRLVQMLASKLSRDAGFVQALKGAGLKN